MTWRQQWAPDISAGTRTGNQGTIRKVISQAGQFGALKLMNSQDVLRTERVARFDAETLALQHLDVFNVPKILEAGKESSGAPYFICEWVEGKTLQNFVSGSPQPLKLALKLSLQLAKILAAVHAQNVVHRDIKPDNLIVCQDGTLWLVDFGISWLDTKSGDQNLTILNDSRMGNHFLALPEFVGRDEKRDPRSDVTQAVGILFFLLTGAKPSQLRDAYLRPPHKGLLAEKFLPANTANPSWYKVLTIFDIGFAQTLTHRFQTAQQLYEHLDAVEDPVTVREEASPALAAARMRFETARMAIASQIDEVESNMLYALNQIATSVDSVAAAEGFNGPSKNACLVERPGYEIAVLWSMNHIRNNEPRIFYKLRACLFGEDNNRVELRLTAQHKNISTLDKRYYETFATDTTGFVTAGEACAREIFIDALEDLTRKYTI